MGERWNRRPQGLNLSEFDADDQLGWLDLLTQERLVEAIKEVRLVKIFIPGLSLNLLVGLSPLVPKV